MYRLKMCHGTASGCKAEQASPNCTMGAGSTGHDSSNNNSKSSGSGGSIPHCLWFLLFTIKELEISLVNGYQTLCLINLKSTL